MTAVAVANPVTVARAAALAANRAFRRHVAACRACARGDCDAARRLDIDAGAADWAYQIAREKAA